VIGTATVATVREADLKDWRLARVLTVRDTDTVASAAARMADHDVGSLVVLGHRQQVVGIMTERDVITKVVSRGSDPSKVSVAAIMSPGVISCRSDTPISKVRRLMTAHNVRHLPVIEDDVAHGMVSVRDILAFELTEYQVLVKKQSDILGQIERDHPEVVHWRRGQGGRIMID
jgi:CBS domain-containing protein